MHMFKQVYPVLLLFGICCKCFSFDDYQHDTGVILDLLGKKGSNKRLINTVVDCLGKTFNTNGRSTDFIRCVNDLIHTDDLTNTDDIRYIMGNYAARSSLLLVKCYLEKSDIIYCLRAFGECLPLLFRNLYGKPEYTRKCKRLVNLPKYDKNEKYLQDDKDEEVTDYDDDYDDYDDYGDYDYDEDEFDEGDFEDFLTEKKEKVEDKRGRQTNESKVGGSEKAGEKVKVMTEPEIITGEIPFEETME